MTNIQENFGLTTSTAVNLDGSMTASRVFGGDGDRTTANHANAVLAITYAYYGNDCLKLAIVRGS